MKQTTLKLTTMPLVVVMAGFLCVNLTSCWVSDDSLSPEGNAEETHVSKYDVGSDEYIAQNYNLSSYSKEPTLESLRVKREAEIAARRVAANMELSQAKLAAKRNDVCPKLLFRDIDSSIVRRAEEVLNTSHCDYYIYPNVGERLTVESNTDIVNAVLVTPTIFDFANGGYVIEHADKHTIRLSYVGSEFLDHPINYDMTVIID